MALSSKQAVQTYCVPFAGTMNVWDDNSKQVLAPVLCVL